eukprot:PhM_4_TR18676/c0_g1_i3/m.71056
MQPLVYQGDPLSSTPDGQPLAHLTHGSKTTLWAISQHNGLLYNSSIPPHISTVFSPNNNNNNIKNEVVTCMGYNAVDRTLWVGIIRRRQQQEGSGCICVYTEPNHESVMELALGSAATPTVIDTCAAPERGVICVGCSNGSLVDVVSGAGDRGAVVATYPAASAACGAVVACTSNANDVFSSHEDGTVSIWTTSGDGRRRATAELEPRSHVTKFVLDARHDRLWGACRDGVIRVWSVADLSRLKMIKAHRGACTGLIAVNEATVWSGGADGCLCVWDMVTFERRGAVQRQAEDDAVIDVVTAYTVECACVWASTLSGKIHSWLVPSTETAKKHAPPPPLSLDTDELKAFLKRKKETMDAELRECHVALEVERWYALELLNVDEARARTEIAEHEYGTVRHLVVLAHAVEDVLVLSDRCRVMELENDRLFMENDETVLRSGLEQDAMCGLYTLRLNLTSCELGFDALSHARFTNETEATISELRAQVQDLRMMLEESDRDRGALKVEVDILHPRSARVPVLEQEKAALFQRVSGLESAFAELTRQYETCRDDLSSVRLHAERAERENEELKRVRDLVDDAVSRAALAEERLAPHKQLTEQLSAELAHSYEEAAAAQKTMLMESAKWQDAALKAQCEAAAAKQRLGEMRQEVSDVEHVHEATLVELHQATSKLASLEDMYRSVKDQLGATEEKLRDVECLRERELSDHHVVAEAYRVQSTVLSDNVEHARQLEHDLVALQATSLSLRSDLDASERMLRARSEELARLNSLNGELQRCLTGVDVFRDRDGVAASTRRTVSAVEALQEENRWLRRRAQELGVPLLGFAEQHHQQHSSSAISMSPSQPHSTPKSMFASHQQAFPSPRVSPAVVAPIPSPPPAALPEVSEIGIQVSVRTDSRASETDAIVVDDSVQPPPSPLVLHTTTSMIIGAEEPSPLASPISAAARAAPDGEGKSVSSAKQVLHQPPLSRRRASTRTRLERSRDKFELLGSSDLSENAHQQQQHLRVFALERSAAPTPTPEEDEAEDDDNEEEEECIPVKAHGTQNATNRGDGKDDDDDEEELVHLRALVRQFQRKLLSIAPSSSSSPPSAFASIRNGSAAVMSEEALNAEALGVLDALTGDIERLRDKLRHHDAAHTARQRKLQEENFTLKQELEVAAHAKLDQAFVESGVGVGSGEQATQNKKGNPLTVELRKKISSLQHALVDAQGEVHDLQIENKDLQIELKSMREDVDAVRRQHNAQERHEDASSRRSSKVLSLVTPLDVEFYEAKLDECEQELAALRRERAEQQAGKTGVKTHEFTTVVVVQHDQRMSAIPAEASTISFHDNNNNNNNISTTHSLTIASFGPSHNNSPTNVEHHLFRHAASASDDTIRNDDELRLLRRRLDAAQDELLMSSRQRREQEQDYYQQRADFEAFVLHHLRAAKRVLLQRRAHPVRVITDLIKRIFGRGVDDSDDNDDDLLVMAEVESVHVSPPRHHHHLRSLVPPQPQPHSQTKMATVVSSSRVSSPSGSPTR